MAELIHADCLEWMREQPDNLVDLSLYSPPYEDARTYGIDFKLKGQDWVDWMVEVVTESVRITKGLVAIVVNGRTRKFSYSCTPELLIADLKRKGVTLRKSLLYHRKGIPGSGGPDYLADRYETIICATSGGRLPWSDNTAMGKPCKYKPGGRMSNRHQDGRRINQKLSKKKKMRNGREAEKLHTKRTANGTVTQGYNPPEKANPGNVVFCKVGGGQMGSDIAHENEAPFPESLAEYIIKSFCPPDGIVLDTFCGSGTTCAVAAKNGRDYIGIEIRESQIEHSTRRIEEALSETNNSPEFNCDLG